jgi:hypothetical protein
MHFYSCNYWIQLAAPNHLNCRSSAIRLFLHPTSLNHLFVSPNCMFIFKYRNSVIIVLLLIDFQHHCSCIPINAVQYNVRPTRIH